MGVIVKSLFGTKNHKNYIHCHNDAWKSTVKMKTIETTKPTHKRNHTKMCEKSAISWMKKKTNKQTVS